MAEAPESEVDELISEDEDEESEDEIQPELDTLIGLAQMDAEAALAYQVVAQLVPNPQLRSKLEEFAEDHVRHVKDIGRYLQSLDEEVTGGGADPESSTFVALAMAAAASGAAAGARALQGNELFTNASYQAALELVTDDEALELVRRNLSDEERHARWLAEHQDADWEAIGEGDSAAAPM